MFNKLKNVGINLDRTVTLGRVDACMDTPEDRGEEVIRRTGEALDVLCATDSPILLDQENSKKRKRYWFQRFCNGFNSAAKKILKEWE
jgi:hypothetical protein